jgi:heme-degrading monooxygenase HmoA
MFLILWEFEVKPGYEERFEKVYGPGGDGAKLFRTDSKYRETRLVRDSFRAAIYLTVDFWDSRQEYEEFLRKRRAEYAAIEAIGEELKRKERRMGCFEMVED